MDDAEHKALVHQLGEMMSDISEDCYCAGWLGGTEYFVPELCRRAAESGQTQFWGHGEITPDRARKLIALADKVGCWAATDYASTGYDPFCPFPIPPEYAEGLSREQTIPRMKKQRERRPKT